MGFVLLIIFALLVYGLTTLFRKWLDIQTLYVVAIGCACNANFFTNFNNVTNFGPFAFSPMIILYALFMYIIMIRMVDYGYKEAKILTYTSVAAIVVSALIELANATIMGFSFEALQTFAAYIFASLGTLVGVWVAVVMTIHARRYKVNKYVIILVGMVIACWVHDIFYYGGIALITLGSTTLGISDYLGIFVGEMFCFAIALFCYFINQRYWKPRSLAE